MLETIDKMLVAVDDFVWGVPLIVLILATGLLLTVRLKGVQATKFVVAVKHLFANDSNGEGEVSSFGALCTALSATIGTGNIVGVATAIVAGGPGALFWMWVAAIVGTATKYAECLLAIKYRVVTEDGHVIGGPFYYIENGMGKNWKWLAKLFAFLGAVVGLLGIGTFTQINGITSAVNNFFDPNNSWVFPIHFFGNTYSWTVVIAGLLLTVFVALVLIGGLKRISKVAEFVVPFMAVIYVVAALLILVLNYKAIPGAFVTIVESAFGLRAVAGGALGAMLVAMQKGIARGIFSNEAGIGSAPIAAAAAKTNEPVELGLPFPNQVASFILMICLVFFAFTTILGWDYYSERCLEYLTENNQKAVKVYRWLYIFCVFIGPYMTVSAVWTIADIFNGLMAIPNLIALIALSGVAASETKSYFERIKK